ASVTNLALRSSRGKWFLPADEVQRTARAAGLAIAPLPASSEQSLPAGSKQSGVGSKTDFLLAALALIAVIYSLAWFGLYRSLMGGQLPFGRSNPDPAPIETTTAEQRACGESSFAILKERTFGITPPGFFALVGLGYVALALGFGIAFYVFRYS